MKKESIDRQPQMCYKIVGTRLSVTLDKTDEDDNEEDDEEANELSLSNINKDDDAENHEADYTTQSYDMYNPDDF